MEESECLENEEKSYNEEPLIEISRNKLSLILQELRNLREMAHNPKIL